MKKLKKKTREDIVSHFQKRCLERIGSILSQRTLRGLLDSHRLHLMGRQSNTRTVFLLERGDYEGLSHDVVLAYDKARHAFVTVMLRSQWSANHNILGERTGND